MNDNPDNKTKKELEDATRYGEFIASYFGWNTLEGQKKKVEKLEKITEDKENKNKN